MNHTLQVVGLTLAMALPLAAQQPAAPNQGQAPEPRHGREWQGPGRMGMGPGAMGTRAGEMPFAPEYLLARNGQLELTAQQITQLTAIRDAARRSAEKAMEQSRRHMDELRAALDAATPDTAAIRTHFLAAHDGMGQARLAAIIASARAKALLTDTQRARVGEWREHRAMNRGPRPAPGRPGREAGPPLDPTR